MLEQGQVHLEEADGREGGKELFEDPIRRGGISIERWVSLCPEGGDHMSLTPC